ncbi:MAG: single-stranded-DNA-specific exonuclease RecJ [Clostridiales bacterium]|nr:single-stranded-DNA-specific exonuclease RecJ [Clostridiales bacterium]
MRKLSPRAIPFTLPGYPDYLAALLHARGISTVQDAQVYLNPKAEHLHNPFLMHGMQKACDLVKQAMEQGQIVAVYGDYDADGVCASAIILEALQALGVKAFPYIPTRQSEGYGINQSAVLMLSKQAEVLFSVDCGITAVDEVDLAKSLGMQVIITDHHTLPESLPDADAIIHPQLAGYPEPNLCGAGVAWKFACALLGQEKAWASLDLAALATVADMVHLTGENRVIVSLGLTEIQQSKRLGLQALMQVAGIRAGTSLTSEHIAFQLAPRLNATGRLADAQDALSLLMSRDQAQANHLAEQMDLLNRERREIEQETLKEASEQVRQMDLRSLRSIVVQGEDWNPGVVGLTAGKLAERWNYPAIALSKNGEEYAGSGRSAGIVDLYAALKDCEAMLTRFGGHTMAAGLAVREENLDAFKTRFDEAVKRQLGEGDLIPETEYDTSLPLSQVNLDTVSLLDQLAPFGMGNPSPVFLMENLQLVTARAVGSEGAHLKLTVGQSGTVRDGIAFGFGMMGKILGKDVTLVGSVARNEFNGKVTAQLKIKALLPGMNAFEQDSLLQARAITSALMGDSLDAGVVHQVTDIPEIGDKRGTLLIAYTHQTANALRQRFPDFQVCVSQATDPRAFNAIVYAPDVDLHFASFEQLIFADGLPNACSVHKALRKTGAKKAFVLPQSKALGDLMTQCTPSIEELRSIYVCLRNGTIAGFTQHPGKDFIALMIFEQLGLVQLDEEGNFRRMLPMKRIGPEQSPLYRKLTT